MIWSGTLFLLCCFLSHQEGECSGQYSLLYGNVLAQTVQNTTTSDSDVEQAVKLGVSRAKLTGVDYHVTDIVKRRLYFTEDGMVPFIFKDGGIRNDTVYITSKQVVMGLLYTFVVQGRLKSGQLGHHFAISRDRNKKYHVFRHTLADVATRDSSKHSECSGNSDGCVLTDSPSPYSFGVANSSASSSKGTKGSTLRVTSYNIWNVNKLQEKGEDYRTRLRRLKKLILSLDADILGLQEVRLEVETPPYSSHSRKRQRKTKPSNTECQVCDFAELLSEYQFVYQPAMLYMERLMERKEEGLAILSRYPILSSDYKLLYRNDSDEDDTHQRICLHAEVDIPQLGAVHVFVSHLSLSERTRETSAVEIWQYIQTFTGPKMLLGDMNAEPGSNIIRFLTGEISLGGLWTNGLKDTWTVLATNLNTSGLTFSALDEEPVKRIDYIFASLPKPLRVMKSEVVADRNICFLPCSDHHAVSTVLSLQ